MPDYVGHIVRSTRVFNGRWSKPNYPGTIVSSASASTPSAQFLNRVYDEVASKYVYWKSSGAPDTTGTQYPGPGVFGTNTSNFTVVKTL